METSTETPRNTQKHTKPQKNTQKHVHSAYRLHKVRAGGSANKILLCHFCYFLLLSLCCKRRDQLISVVPALRGVRGVRGSEGSGGSPMRLRSTRPLRCLVYYQSMICLILACPTNRGVFSLFSFWQTLDQPALSSLGQIADCWLLFVYLFVEDQKNSVPSASTNTNTQSL